MAVQTLLVLLMLVTSTFEAVLLYAQFSILACSFLTVLGVMILRWRQPALPRPFRCFGYPVTPVIFLALNLFAMIYTALDRPEQAFAGLATLLLGIGTVFSRSAKQNRPMRLSSLVAVSFLALSVGVQAQKSAARCLRKGSAMRSHYQCWPATT